MKCPKCRLPEMEHIMFEGIAVERCPTCRGLALSRAQMEILLRSRLGEVADNPVFAPTPEALDNASAWCERCEREMELVKGPFDVFVDWCPGCGLIFLDPGELASLQRNPITLA
ncbi:MAG: zf-TFIIB domain-containing protein [Deltaproteobacteria bacterium]|nr:zf-TFIIB domain-containing protein [Deltaproteobacteria bacterium]